MILHTRLALIRPLCLFLRSLIVLVVLFSLLFAPSNTDRVHHSARVEASSPTTLPQITAALSTFPLSFVANAGQIDSQVHFYAQGMRSELFFSPQALTLILPTSGGEKTHETVLMSFVGANANPTITGEDQLPGIVNYLYGNDPAQWVVDVPTYGALLYQQLYPGIDLHYEGTEGVLKSTYLIAPGADPQLIRWQYDGVSQMRIDPETRDLRLYLSDTDENPALIELAPVAWQNIGSQRVPVDISYALLENHTIGFTLGGYDPAYTLYLDPEVQLSTYLGGSAIDEGLAIAVDVSANVYITGRTGSYNFPGPTSPPLPPFQGAQAGAGDAFITKISLSTKLMVYRTYLGGSQYDIAYDIAIDSSGNAYVTGETQSENFPISSGDVHQPTYAGGTDGFVTKLNSTGSALVYSTFLGGLGLDRGQGIAVDSSGYAYVTGETNSSPTSFGIFNTLPGGGVYAGGASDAFVTKFNADGTDVLLSSFLGGSDIDRGEDIVVDASSGVAYIAGRTDSLTGFPLVNASQGTYGGGGDAFVSRITTVGTPAYTYSTYLGGSGLDNAKGIALASGGKVYVTGETGSANFPQLGGLPAGQGGTDQGGLDAFITAYGSGGGRVYSTYLGGSNDDKGEGIALDSSGNIYVAGQTQSPDFPYIGGFQESGFGGLSDAFVTKILAAGTMVEYSSYIGGALTDQAFDLAVGSGSSVYLTGNTNSDPFPVTPGSFQRGGVIDAFLIRIGSTSADVFIEKIDDMPTVAVGQDLSYTITVRNNGPDPTVVTVTDKLSSYVSYVSAVPEPANPNVSCSYASSTRIVTCELGNMLAGAVIVIKLTVNITTMPPTSNISNTATATGSEFDPVNANNSYTQPTLVYAQADLEVTKSADSYRVKRNEPVQFSIAIKNLGPGTATGVSLRDVLPPEMTFVSAIPPGTSTYNAGTGLWTVGSIARNATVTLVITATVKETVPITTLFTNTADNLVANEFDPDSVNNSSTIQLRVVSQFPEPGCHPSPVTSGEVICLSG